MAVFRLFGRTLPVHYALLGRKRKLRKIKDDSKIDREKNIDRREARSETNWDSLTHSRPPYFLVADYL
jgi:hypothetical protein